MSCSMQEAQPCCSQSHCSTPTSILGYSTARDHPHALRVNASVGPHRLRDAMPARITAWRLKATASSPLRLAPQSMTRLTHHYYRATLFSCDSNARATIHAHPMEAISSKSRAINMLHGSVDELQETSHSICRSIGGNTGSVSGLPGQPAA